MEQLITQILFSLFAALWLWFWIRCLLRKEIVFQQGKGRSLHLHPRSYICWMVYHLFMVTVFVGVAIASWVLL